MRQADAILQEVWRIKDTAYKQAGSNSQLFVAQLLERSAQLRAGLDLKDIHTVDRRKSPPLPSMPV